jgi:hypothetical protein
MVAILSPHDDDNADITPRLVRVRVTRPPIAAVVSSPDGGQTFTISGLSRVEATHLAILLAERDSPITQYIGVSLGRSLFPDVEVRS